MKGYKPGVTRKNVNDLLAAQKNRRSEYLRGAIHEAGERVRADDAKNRALKKKTK